MFETTQSRRLVRTLSLSFAPSRDEEHVDVVLRTDDGLELALPPRASHYVLLTLARARIQDALDGVVEEERGWLYSSELAQKLGYTAERLVTITGRYTRGAGAAPCGG